MDYAEHRQKECIRTAKRDDLSPTTRALSEAGTEAETMLDAGHATADLSGLC